MTKNKQIKEISKQFKINISVIYRSRRKIIRRKLAKYLTNTNKKWIEYVVVIRGYAICTQMKNNNRI